MTNPSYLLVVFFSLILLISCKNDAGKNAKETEENPISFETKSFERKGGDCKEEHKRCVVVKLNYPFAKDGLETTRKSINQYVSSVLLESIIPDPNEKITDFDTAAAQLIKYYEEQMAEFPEYEMGWAVEVNGNAELIDSFAVITLPIYSFMGGAHPNHFTSITNFNLKSGKEIKLLDIVVDTKALKTLAEKRFIEARISDYDVEEVDINDFFFGDGYHLPENFAITKDGIFFYYNPYEAAPYALGTTEFLISFKDLEGIVKL